MKIKQLVKSMALTAGLAASFTASADFVDFTVDEGYAAANGSAVTADKINGGYVERITFDGNGNFEADAFATFGQFFLGSNSLNSGLNNTYSLYATFDASGTAGSEGNVEYFSGNSGSFQLYLDTNNDTMLSDDEDVNSIVGNGEDILLGSSSALGENLGTSSTVQGQTVTAFDFNFLDFDLTDEGDQYFISPMPFSVTVKVNGDFDSFEQTGTQITRGDVSAQFENAGGVTEVPEPSTIAVMALGLLGLGAARRRKA